MLKPILILVACAAFGFSLVFAMPDQIRLLPSAVSMDWPNQEGPWVKMRDTEPSPQEIAILAGDTSFSSATFVREGSPLILDAGIVLSGDDINNSIHRPERCLVAQGHMGLQPIKLEVPMKNGQSLPVTRLRTRIHRGEATPDGEVITHKAVGLTYYWFIGNDLITNSHYRRTFEDMSDRLFQGSNQRWAYITLSVYLRETKETLDMIPAEPTGEAPIDAFIQDFIAQVIPRMVDYEMIRP